MKELEILLENYWIIKEKNIDLFHSIKDASPKFKGFIEEKLGYRLIINPYLIKLEKTPGRPEKWMGIRDFDSNIDYALFCMLLAFLEDRGNGDQFVLSQLTEYLQASWTSTEKLDWTLFRHRRSLVKIMRFASNMHLVKVNDGDESKFIDMADTEVLYESTGISRYFVRNFTTNILNYNTWKDIEAGEWLEADTDRGRVRRNRVYRRLVMSPAVYNEGSEDSDYAYIKNYKNMIHNDLEEMLDTSLHVHKNGAFLVYETAKQQMEVFPGNSTLSDIVLQINSEIVKMVKEGQLIRREDDIIQISSSQFELIIEDCRNNYMHGWSKEYREMGIESLRTNVLEFMEGYSMVEKAGREINILPLCGKVIGFYPMNFNKKKDSES